MIAIRNYPFKKLYKTFEEYAEKERGFIYNKHFGGYGYTYNPKAFYDWCVIGGRWPEMFLVKEDCQEYSNGECSLDDNEEKNKAPEGYRWVTAARKKDIQWQIMREWEIERSKKSFFEYEKAYKTGIIPSGHFWEICGNMLVGYGGILYIEGENVESYLKRRHLCDSFKYPAVIYGFLDDNGYHEEAYVQRNSGTRKCINRQKKKNRIEWRRKLDKFIDSIPDDEVIVGVDCHI